MRILYIDIDSLRPDHLGCYGYHRRTSPNMDRVAQEGICFENCYASDSPCLPSRTALFSGRFGLQTGVVGHGGTAAQPFIEGINRGFNDEFGRTSWMAALRRNGYRTAAVSSFGQRHAAWHWYAGFHHVLDCGGGGHETAEVVTPLALDWLERYGRDSNWFLHVNFWDVHIPFRTPMDYGNPFEHDPAPDWITQDYIDRSQDACGMRCAQEAIGNGWGGAEGDKRYPREPAQLATLADVKQWIDGYDVGIHYVDFHIGLLLSKLQTSGIYDDTAIIISADHGEHLGELNVWGGHHMADHWINRVPMIVRWPGVTPGVDRGLHYQFDIAATAIERIGGQVPDNWAGIPSSRGGRDHLILSHAAMTAQRSVRFDDYICVRTYHDGYKLLNPTMLFNLRDDPHEIRNLAADQPQTVDYALRLLAEWQAEMMISSAQAVDPLMTVLMEGGPAHSRGRLPAYLERLRGSGRAHLAKRLMEKHPQQARS
ncbi:MAG: sulfatase [Anaerolineae bacterium]|nr:sulfatase [Anaerolineae bacterium]